MTSLQVANPYWDQVADNVAPGYFGGLQVGGRVDGIGMDTGFWERRFELAGLYSWSIPDPATLEFVTKHANGKLMDVMAGTGYWALMLEQMGVDVISYDIKPGDNQWCDGMLYVAVNQMDATEAVLLHPERSLFMSWPPMSNDGYRTICAYQGDRIILVGEDAGGCTGSDRMFDELDTNWTLVDGHRPVQWWGVNDEVTVYDRKLLA